MKNIKAIIFDAYGTLFDVNSAAEKSKGKIGETYHFSGNSFVSVMDTVKYLCDLKAYNVKKLIKKTKSRILWKER